MTLAGSQKYSRPPQVTSGWFVWYLTFIALYMAFSPGYSFRISSLSALASSTVISFLIASFGAPIP